MSSDPLDSVGQGFGWYGYNVPCAGSDSGVDVRQLDSRGDASVTRQAASGAGGLMADQLFGGKSAASSARVQCQEDTSLSNAATDTASVREGTNRVGVENAVDRTNGVCPFGVNLGMWNWYLPASPAIGPMTVQPNASTPLPLASMPPGQLGGQAVIDPMGRPAPDVIGLQGQQVQPLGSLEDTSTGISSLFGTDESGVAQPSTGKDITAVEGDKLSTDIFLQNQEHIVGAGPTKNDDPRQSGTLDTFELKRQERNAREQRRSFKISQQIDKLRKLLSETGIEAKSNKSSVLSEVANYMGKLEKRAQEMEEERQRWMAESTEVPEIARRDANGGTIDCKQVFAHASVALAMATVEGRIMENNFQFEALSGYSSEELKQLTLLSLTSPSELERLFELLSAMITDGSGKAPQHVMAKAVLKDKDADLSLSVSLARDALGRPRFFLCSLLPHGSATNKDGPSDLASETESKSSNTRSLRGLASGTCAQHTRSEHSKPAVS